jgi:hypothetical protein
MKPYDTSESKEGLAKVFVLRGGLQHLQSAG